LQNEKTTEEWELLELSKEKLEVQTIASLAGQRTMTTLIYVRMKLPYYFVSDSNKNKPPHQKIATYIQSICE